MLPKNFVPPRRVAFSEDLGGICKVQPAVAQACREAVQWFATAVGTEVVQAAPDVHDAAHLFQAGHAKPSALLGIVTQLAVQVAGMRVVMDVRSAAMTVFQRIVCCALLTSLGAVGGAGCVACLLAVWDKTLLCCPASTG